jgi:hypothetical protein
MNALHATLRPAWRPASFVQLTLMSFVVAFLLQVVAGESEAMPVIAALWTGTATPARMTALWAVLVVAPAGAGVILALVRMDLQHTTLSWHLPDLRSRLLRGTVVCGLAVAGSMALLVARNTASASVIGAAFSLAFCAFLAPGFVGDAAVARPVRALVALPWLATIVRPGATARIAHDFPLLVAAICIALAGLQLHAIGSAGTARARLSRWSAFRAAGRDGRARRPASRARLGGRWTAHQRQWLTTLDNSRLLPWLRAAAWESEMSYPLTHVGAAVICVLGARLIDLPLVLPALASSFLMKNGLQLRMRVAYPLSRIRRARLAYAGSVVDAGTYFLFVGLLLYATELVPLPRLPGADWDPARPTLWMLAWGCSLALAPVAQWRGIRWPDELPGSLSGIRLLGFLAQFFLYALLVILAAGQINVATRSTGGIDTALIAVGMLIVITQAIHAALVFAYCTRSDLVRSPNPT